MKLICQIISGSKLYGLETPESDTDTRGVFLNTDPSDILGLNRNEIIKEENQDFLLFELRHFLRGLKKTNTQMVEILFADQQNFSIIEPEFIKIQQNRTRLIESKVLFKSLLGYIQNEKRLANGERTGNLGSKRKNNIEKYGFSPKNFSHLFRLAHCGSKFFETGHYPVNISKHDPQFRNFLFSIKTEPEKYNKDYLNILTQKAIDKLKFSFDKRKEDFHFDDEFANKLCLEFYLPFLN